MKLFDFINGKKTMIGTIGFFLIGLITYINGFFPLPEAIVAFVVGLKPLFIGLGAIGIGHKANKIEAAQK